MSLFRSTTLPCPACGADCTFQAVHSVNIDRRPDLREAILEGSFQQTTCASCGESFRLDPQFNYLDLERGDWIAAYPSDELAHWRALEEEVRGVWSIAFGDAAPAVARELAAERGMSPRLVFGWPALWEKIQARQHGLDDRQLEVFKAGLLKSLPEVSVAPDVELRFLHVPDDDADVFAMAWLDADTGDFLDGLRVPRALYDAVAEEPEAWGDLRADFPPDALLVDLGRLLTAGV